MLWWLPCGWNMCNVCFTAWGITCVYRFAITAPKLSSAKQPAQRRNHVYFTTLEANGWGKQMTYRRLGQSSPFWATSFLRRFCQICQFRKLDHPVFISLHFGTIYTYIYFFYRASVSVLHEPPVWKTRYLYLCPQVTGCPVIPQASGSLFVAFHDSLGYGGGIVTRLHSGYR
jgi:hypothetical protein